MPHETFHGEHRPGYLRVLIHHPCQSLQLPENQRPGSEEALGSEEAQRQ